MRDHRHRQKRVLRLARQIRDRRLPHHDRLLRVLELSLAKPSTKRQREYRRKNTVTSYKHLLSICIYSARKVTIPYKHFSELLVNRPCAGLSVGKRYCVA